MPLFPQVLCSFCLVIAIVTSFISHTVGAMVMLPIVQNVGQEIARTTGHDHSLLLVMGCALMCSGGMALPVSGFPNMTASSLEDPTGRKYVGFKDFLKTGVAGTAIAFVLVVTVGYPLMLLVGM
jgi:di/tricarboxylate transporter